MPTTPRTDITSCHGQDVKVDQPPPPLIPIADGTVTVQSMRPAQQPSTGRPGRSSKTRLRKKRRLLKEKELTSFNQLEENNGVPGEVSIPALQLKAGIRTQRVRHLMAMLLGVDLVFEMIGRHFHCPNRASKRSIHD